MTSPHIEPSRFELERRLAKLDEQIASVERRRSFGDSSVDYASYRELKAKREYVQEQLRQLEGKPRRRIIKMNARKGL